MLKKVIIYSVFFALVMGEVISFSQDIESEKKSTSSQSPSDDYTTDGRIPNLYKRLTEAIKSLKFKADDEGKYTFVIKAGNQYDLVDRVFLVYNKKAMVYGSQGRITRIVFEYYQFNMTTQVREVKTFTSSAPDSPDLRPLLIEYVNTIGQNDKFTVGELQKPESRRDVLKQFYSYYLALVYKLELYKDKTIKTESSKIDRAIQLGE
ncbi:MAG TPA: hypothetical protein PKN50_04960 [Spirochaetota bacterium]|nr:hypothetical protein [Spirochaetota bacterium]HPV41539.1 hypothetical protein [Spirochaetota bacterium]